MAGDDLGVRLVGRQGQLEAAAFLTAIHETVGGLRALSRGSSQRWLIGGLSMHSPANVLVRPRKPGLGEARAWVAGLRILEASDTAPAGWDKAALRRARSAVSTLGRGLTGLTYSAGDDSVTPTFHLVANVNRLLGTDVGPHSILTTIEGRLEAVNVHGARPEFNIYDPVSSAAVRCVFKEEDIGRVGGLLRRRVSVYGLAQYGEDGWPQSILVETLEPMPTSEELKLGERMRRVEITDGMDTTEYVRKLRHAE